MRLSARFTCKKNKNKCNYNTEKLGPDLFGPFGHDMGAGCPKMQVEHNYAIQHHHSDQYHDKHQIPVKIKKFKKHFITFLLLLINK